MYNQIAPMKIPPFQRQQQHSNVPFEHLGDNSYLQGCSSSFLLGQHSSTDHYAHRHKDSSDLHTQSDRSARTIRLRAVAAISVDNPNAISHLESVQSGEEGTLPSYRPRRTFLLSGGLWSACRHNNRSQVRVPWLQLRGHWLDKADFGINVPVTVRVMEGCLVLTTESTGS